ncbi:hypothetical protein BVY03_01515 [bacterium K02(2017)]|nr:hypothetical protein BVY03_01515 [bacterium K02(2017)]
MVSSIGYSSTDYSAAMDTIRSEVEAYCETHGIDPDEYLASLDGNLTAHVFNNETFEAYFQLAYMQLMEILYPEQINSLEAEVGGDVNFETLYANSNDDINSLVKDLVEDSPELMAYFAQLESGQDESEALLGLLSAEQAKQTGQNFTDDARSLNESFDLGPGFEWVIDKEEGFKAAQMSILDRLSEFDEMQVELLNFFHDPNSEMSMEEFEAQSKELYYGRETMLGMLQSLTSAEATFFEMMSKIYQTAIETSQNVIRTWV